MTADSPIHYALAVETFAAQLAVLPEPEFCDWCAAPGRIPAYRKGLCRAHWDEAHDNWDVDE